MKKMIALVFGLLVSFAASAASDANRAITSIGVQNQTAYLVLNPAPSGSCLYNVVYLADLSTASGKSLYATLLTAYSQGKVLQRVDYLKDGSGICTINLIEVGA